MYDRRGTPNAPLHSMVLAATKEYVKIMIDPRDFSAPAWCNWFAIYFKSIQLTPVTLESADRQLLVKKGADGKWRLRFELDTARLGESVWDHPELKSYLGTWSGSLNCQSI